MTGEVELIELVDLTPKLFRNRIVDSALRELLPSRLQLKLFSKNGNVGKNPGKAFRYDPSILMDNSKHGRGRLQEHRGRARC